jgi:protein TonB
VQPLSGLDSPTADLSNNPPPAYPLEAVRRQLEGVVLLRLHVAETGAVSHVELIESSGHRILDQAAIDSVALWKGEPATRWGRPISSVETLPIRFRL